MSDERARSGMPLTKIILTGSVTLFVLAALVFGVASEIARGRADDVLKAWERSLGSMDEIPARYPSSEANDSALAVEAAAASLGIAIAPRLEGRARPTAEQAGAYRPAGAEIGRYVKRQLERSYPGIDPPPESVASFLADHQKTLERLRRQLRDREPPRWELQIDKLAAAPIPNLLGHVAVQKLLLADALAAAGSGDAERALADLEASWRLNTALRDRPTLITQLAAITVVRLEAGTLRRLERVSPGWPARLVDHDFKASLAAALRYEAWGWMRLPTRMAHGTGFWQRTAMKLMKPYWQYGTADLSDALRLQLEQLVELDYLCDRDLAAHDAGLELSPPRWNYVGRIVAPQLDGIPPRLARLEVDLELTRKILELAAARQANGGIWPAAIPGIEVSAACPNDRWIYTVTAGEGMSIALSRALEWPELKGVSLPTRYTAATP